MYVMGVNHENYKSSDTVVWGLSQGMPGEPSLVASDDSLSFGDSMALTGLF